MELSSEVMAYMQRLPQGTPASAKELLHLGSRAAVDQTLSRLARRGSLLRISRGLYVLPVETRFGVRPPEASRVVQAIAEQRGESIVSTGAAAANELGLTTQVPIREVYLTSGRTRKLTVGEQKIELRHAPRWQLVHPGRPAGTAIRALASLGPEHAGKAVALLRNSLPGEELRAMVAARAMLPTWLAQQVSVLAAHV